MALTQISTNGIKNGTITGSDLATNLDLVDNQKLRLGTGNDLQIFHDGTHSRIKNSTGDLFINSDTIIRLQSFTGSETMAKFFQNGAAELYHDNSKKFETTSTGTRTTGISVVGANAVGMGSLNAATQFVVTNLSGNNNSVDMTILGGRTGKSSVVFGDHDDVNMGSITYDHDDESINFKNNNSNTNKLVITSGGNVQIPVDNSKLQIGAGNDLQLYHDGSNSYIANTTGTVQLTSTGITTLKGTSITFENVAGNENTLRSFQNGAVELYYDNSKKLETTSTGATLTGNATINGEIIVNDDININADNKKLNIGLGADLQLYHDGTNSRIVESGAGAFMIQGNYVDINSVDGSELKARFIDNGAVELYYDNSKKFHTKNGGVYITGDIETSGDLYMLDNEKIRIGNSQDLELYHDGTSSVIKNLTNDLYVQSIADVKLRTNDSELAVDCTVNGSVALYYDASKKFETQSSGVTLFGDMYGGDNIVLRLGDATGGDLRIYHSGSASYISDQGTGELILKSNSISFTNAAENEHLARFFQDSAVELYYDGGRKFETRSDGVKLSQGHFYADDHSRIKLGDGQDLEVYHDGTNSSIKNTTGDLYIYDTGGNIYIQANTPEQSIIAFANGSTELYYDNSVRIRTQSYGIEYHNQQHKFMHTNSGGLGAYLSLMNSGTAAGGKTGIVFGIGNSNAILDGGDYGEGQIKCFTDSGLYGNLEFNLHVGANRSYMKIVGNGASHNGAGAGSEGMRGGVAFGCAGIAIDRSWTGQPGIHVFNQNTEGDTDQGTFRFHGWNRSYASYPDSSGSDFSVNLVADGSGLSSDERRKTGIATITNALDTITKMRGVSFQFVNRELDPQTHMSMDNGKKLGFIAQEVIPLLPQLILDSGEKNVPLENGWCDRYSMDYAGVTAVLVEAIKELAAKVASLESKITE